MDDSAKEDLSELTTEQRKALARERWEALPSVVRGIFANAPKRPMFEVLRSLGVDVGPSRSVEWAYVAKDGSLVVTIWHDQIRVMEDGALGYFIPISKWRRTGIQQSRADQMKALLLANVGTPVRAMLLRHEWDAKGSQFAKERAADMKSWLVTKTGDEEFLLIRGGRAASGPK